ncbi:MAG: flagellar motor switch protein FliG [Candidatus Latescibacterota bacterium]|jgi:flagellar motor switch protein FliG
MSENAKVYHLPTEEELGEVEPLQDAGQRGWSVATRADETPDLPAGMAAHITHAYIWQHAQEAAAVVRSLLRGGAGGEGPLAGMSAEQVVAAFFIALGQEVGVRVLRQLEQDEAAQVGRAVAACEAVKHNAGMHALETVRQRVEDGEYLDLGGEKLARALMSGAVAPWWASRILDEAQVADESPWELLEKTGPDQVSPFISHEHPQTIAFILSQIPAGSSGGILNNFPERLQADVAYRMATMEDVTRATVERAERALRSMFGEMRSQLQDVGGPKVVADMLNMTGSSVEKNVLDQIDTQDPQVAEGVRNLMFTFHDIAKLTDREIQIVMREVDQKDLVVALKAAREELKDKVLGNMSEKVRTAITEEMEFLGPMRLSEVEEVQLRIVQQVRQLEEKGEITIVRGETDDQFC